jgi:hypothetical protein
MSKKYWLCKRGKNYFSFDSETGKRESLHTDDKDEATRIVHAKNDALRQSGINVAIAKAYLVGADPRLVERTWSWVMQDYCTRGKATTQKRNQRAIRNKSFNLIRDKKLIETTADDLRAVMKSGGTFTNHFLRCLHNSALGFRQVTLPPLEPDGTVSKWFPWWRRMF